MHVTAIPQLWRCLAKQFGATVHQMTSADEYSAPALYIEYAWYWRDSMEIWLGYYDDAAVRELSFFHELGHVVLERMKTPVDPESFMPSKANYADMNLYAAEQEAWRIGLALAQHNGVEFGPKVLARAAVYLGTYARNNKTAVATLDA